MFWTDAFVNRAHVRWFLGVQGARISSSLLPKHRVRVRRPTDGRTKYRNGDVLWRAPRRGGVKTGYAAFFTGPEGNRTGWKRATDVANARGKYPKKRDEPNATVANYYWRVWRVPLAHTRAEAHARRPTMRNKHTRRTHAPTVTEIVITTTLRSSDALSVETLKKPPERAAGSTVGSCCPADI